MRLREKTVQNAEKIWSIVDSKQADYIELSDRVFEMPELNYREVKSAAAHAAQLEPPMTPEGLWTSSASGSRETPISSRERSFRHCRRNS